MDDDDALGVPTEFDEADAERARELQEFWEAARIRTGVTRTAVVTGMSAEATVPPPAWAFGDNPRLADELLDLVLAGTKTATATSVAELELGDEPIPQAGDLSIILDGSGRPRALIRTTGVEIVPFGQITEAQASLEGEGDGSLASWRREHEAYFRRVLAEIGTEFSPDLPIAFETFELLYPRPSDRRDFGPKAWDGGLP
jgi:uncharacterized protein YhfF